MSPPVSLRFQYTEDDYVRAMRLHHSRLLRLPRDYVIGTCMVLFSAGVLAWHPWRWLGGVALAISVLFLAMCLYGGVLLPRLMFRRTPKLHHAYALDFGREDILFRTEGIESRVAWSFYSGLRSDAHTHLLVYGNAAGFTALPRRIFADAAQEEAFLSLAREALPTPGAAR
jgi:hypothetical protein